MSDPVELRLLEDVLSGGGALALPDDRLHRVVHVVHGSLDVGGHELGDDEAWHGCGGARLTAGPGGAALWRWELAPAGSLPVSLRGDAGTSALRLRCPLAWPVDEQTRRRFQEDLLQLIEIERKTFIFVTHSIEEAVYISDRIVLLSPRPGRVARVIEPRIDRSAGPDLIRRDSAYLDTVEEIWQGLKHYVE